MNCTLPRWPPCTRQPGEPPSSEPQLDKLSPRSLGRFRPCLCIAACRAMPCHVVACCAHLLCLPLLGPLRLPPATEQIGADGSAFHPFPTSQHSKPLDPPRHHHPSVGRTPRGCSPPPRTAACCCACCCTAPTSATRCAPPPSRASGRTACWTSSSDRQGCYSAGQWTKAMCSRLCGRGGGGRPWHVAGVRARSAASSTVAVESLQHIRDNATSLQGDMERAAGLPVSPMRALALCFANKQENPAPWCLAGRHGACGWAAGVANVRSRQGRRGSKPDQFH